MTITNQIVEDIHEIMQAIAQGDENKLWKSFYSIKTDLEFDPNTSRREKDILTFLDTHIIDAFRKKKITQIAPQLADLKSSLDLRLN